MFYATHTSILLPLGNGDLERLMEKYPRSKDYVWSVKAGSSAGILHSITLTIKRQNTFFLCKIGPWEKNIELLRFYLCYEDVKKLLEYEKNLPKYCYQHLRTFIEQVDHMTSKYPDLKIAKEDQ